MKSIYDRTGSMPPPEATNGAIKRSLRELRNELSLLNHQIGTRLALRDVDLDCLDLIVRGGPQSPSVLGQRTGLHPATMTGVLDRLERAGWVARERDPEDRRAVLVRAMPQRVGEVVRLYGDMNGSIDAICAEFGPADLSTIARFLDRIAVAGRDAAARLAAPPPTGGQNRK